MDKYLDIYIPDDEELHGMSYSKLIGAVHGVNQNAPAPLALSFPRWVDPLIVQGKLFSKGTLGCVLRVFSSEASLQLLMKRTELTSAAAARLIHVDTVKETPSDCQWVSFRRERTADKAGASHLRRLARRRAARGDSPEIEEQPRKASKVPFQVIDAYSHSTDSRFGLRIKRQALTAGPASPSVSKFDSYGLALEGSAVPSF